MSKKISAQVSESAIRGIVKEFFVGSTQGAFDPSSDRLKTLAATTVDPWVLRYDTFPVTDPNISSDAMLNPDIVPQNKYELEISLKQLFKDIEDTDVSDIFKQIKEIVEEILEEEGDEEMKDKIEESIRNEVRKLIKAQNKEPKEISEVRKAVRKIIAEALPTTGGLGGDFAGFSKKNIENDEEESEQKKKARTVSDVGGVPWEQLKAVSGHSGKGTSGIEQYVYGKPIEPGGPPLGGLVQRFADIIAAKAPSVQAYIDDETNRQKKGREGKGQLLAVRGMIVRDLIDEYIDYLESSGVLDPEDVEFMRNNPEAIETRPMFHDMLQKTVDDLESKEDPTDETKFVMSDLKKYLRDLKSKFGE